MRIALLLLCVICAGSAVAAPASIVIGKHPSPIETLAAREVQKHLYAATGALLPLVHSAPSDAIAVGTPDSNPLARKLRPALTELGDEGYVVQTVRDGKRRVLLVTGNTPNAVLHGAYALLEQYGFGFYLGGDAIPPKKPFKLLDISISREPAFAVRGLLPWYNFFNSPTTWDFEDYAFFFDQMARTKNNFIGFHSYDGEPFAAYHENGKFVRGEPLLSTANSNWGTVSMMASEFGGDTFKYFADRYFGAKPSLYRDDRERSIADAQALLARALDYAKSRGLKTCVGFEVAAADPTGPAEIARLEARLKHLIKTYPMLDYVWVWEVESQAVTPNPPMPMDSGIGAYYRRYQKTFAYLNDPKRAAEAARLAVYAREAHRILSDIAPSVRLVLSGWGGDKWLKCSDFYPGLDKILSKEIIFAALDNIAVTDQVSEAYGKLSPDRERWPIPWLEYDGDQWFPQCNAKAFGNSVRDSLAKGCQGILGIHWRTRDVEESHAYMSRLAWEPTLTYDEFYRTYAKRCFGEEHASEMASLLMEMQALGYRLIGGSGQAECGGFTWGTATDPAKIAPLARVLERLRAVQTALSQSAGTEREAAKVAYVADTCEWALRYEQTAALLREGGEVRKLLTQARSEQAAGDRAKATDTAQSALRQLREAGFETALDTLGHRLTNKGELGILATVNAKAWDDHRKVVGELLEMAGTTPSPSPAGKGWGEGGRLSSGPVLSPIGPNATWFLGDRLPIRAVVHKDGCGVRVVYRQIGEAATSASELDLRSMRYFEGSIACPSNARTGIEYALELIDAGKVIERWPGKDLMHQVTLVPSVVPTKWDGWPVLGPPVMMGEIKVARGEDATLEVSWRGGAGRYEIKRSEAGGPFEPLRTTSDRWLEDRTAKPGTAYRYSVTPLGTTVPGKTMISAAVNAPPLPMLASPKVEARSKRGQVALAWPASTLGVGGYLAYRAPGPDGPWECLNPDEPRSPQHWRENVFVASAPETVMYYKVAVLGRDGREAAVSEPVNAAAQPAGEPKPVLSVDFDTDVPGMIWGGSRSVADIGGVKAAYFVNGGHARIPHSIELNPPGDFAVEFWVKLESAGVMPVLLSHGQFGVDGWFVQSISGQLRFYLHGVGTLDVPGIQPGRWHHFVGTYDGAEMAVYMNGGRARAMAGQGTIAPSSRDLYIGRYDIDAPEYATECRMTGVRVYSTALAPDEVKTAYSRLSGSLK